MHLDAFYVAFIKGGAAKDNIGEVIRNYCSYRYIFEGSLMKNYLRRRYGKQLNIRSAEDVLDFISKYIV